MTDHATPDILDRLAGVSVGSTLDVVRHERPETRRNVQASYDALFETGDEAEVTATERHAVAAFVALLHDADGPAANHYLQLLEQRPDADGLVGVLRSQAKRAATAGPYGAYPSGPLSRENLAGPIFSTEPSDRAVLGERLSAALDHVHLLVFHLRDAQAPHLALLQQAGWNTAAIVTLSQIVAFLSFQIRAAQGLRVLGS
ncbi:MULTISPECIES: CMD domain protein [unclassified Bosea (in: a-proteobacteria)]|uniref:CMD domain protein n=1 Tax=unclassified Bosea (in: a-proteobacteria) TaxID=2653178 RepID=UPI000F75EE68|nr:MULTISPECIES: CMD domain protein [unclassified Bosea (in: a-proteobacteria)]AZO80498.1 CMD domain protein [Bosea sp. Tri-49]RXT23304.1 CMD domain protein [Bosea sp. Tri-39]RXT38777.1 CMD domain protein [Bosea sp. Tri-54]